MRRCAVEQQMWKWSRPLQVKASKSVIRWLQIFRAVAEHRLCSGLSGTKSPFSPRCKHLPDILPVCKFRSQSHKGRVVQNRKRQRLSFEICFGGDMTYPDEVFRKRAGLGSWLWEGYVILLGKSTFFLEIPQSILRVSFSDFCVFANRADVVPVGAVVPLKVSEVETFSTNWRVLSQVFLN
eukprot:g34793.t1